jgi:sulfur carrier protein ThiS
VKVHVELHGRERRDFEIPVSPGMTVLEIMRKISVNPEGVVTFLRDAPVPVDQIVNDGDEFVFIEAASGGL